MVVDMGYWSKVIKKIIFLLLSLFIIFFILKIACFYIPFLIAFIISLITEPIIKFLSKKTKIQRKICAIFTLIVIFTVLVGLISLIIFILLNEATSLLQGLNVYIELVYNKIEEYSSKVKFDSLNIPVQVIAMIENSIQDFINLATKWITAFLTSIMQVVKLLPIIGIYIVITILSTYFICTDRFYIIDQLEHHFPKTWLKKFNIQLKKTTKILGEYLKAELILILISFIEIIVGIYILKFIGFQIDYPFLAALGISFVDALPILGAGVVLIPWAIISSLNGNIGLAIGLIIIYIVVLVVRQILEPKIVSNKIGTHPIFTLIAMYTGFKAIGIIGLFVGPIILIILKNVFETMIDDGFVKSILYRS